MGGNGLRLALAGDDGIGVKGVHVMGVIY